jgi:hypothetical protein
VAAGVGHAAGAHASPAGPQLQALAPPPAHTAGAPAAAAAAPPQEAPGRRKGRPTVGAGVAAGLPAALAAAGAGVVQQGGHACMKCGESLTAKTRPACGKHAKCCRSDQAAAGAAGTSSLCPNHKALGGGR